MGCALGAAMTGWVLGWIGYQQPVAGVAVQQSDVTLFGLRVMMSLVPAAFLVAAAACVVFYEISQQLASVIEADLKSRRSAEPSSGGASS
jgi:GPH family glycoside/pentoside/hexuronide:cation symporter